MNRSGILPWVIAALLLSGCGSLSIGEPTIDLDAAAARAARIDSHSTRADVHGLMGEPWLASDTLRVEVYRYVGKQRNLAVILGVPMPTPSDALEAYSLVIYGADGHVAARAADYASGVWPQPATVVLHAGGFEFVHAERFELSMSLASYLTARAASDEAHDCSVLVGCDPQRQDEAAAEGFCQCAADLAVDEGKRRMLRVSTPTLRQMPKTAEADCVATGGHYRETGTCVFTPRTLYPITLARGPHTLRFTKGAFDQGVTREMTCRDGDVTYATLRKTFMFCMRLAPPYEMPDNSAAGEALSLAPQLPPDSPDMYVIVNDNGRWLLPTARAPR